SVTVPSKSRASRTARKLPGGEKLGGRPEVCAAGAVGGDPAARRRRAPLRQARLDDNRSGRDELTLPGVTVRVANHGHHSAEVVEPRQLLSFAHLDPAEPVPRLAGGDRRLGPELDHERLTREARIALDSERAARGFGAGLRVVVWPRR